MRILHINSYFSTTALYDELHQRQVADGHEIDVYVPIPKNFKDDRLKAKGESTQIVRVFDEWNRYIFHLKHYKILKDLTKRYDFNKFDIVHAHSLFSNGWLAYQLKKRYGLPYIVACRGTDINTFFKYQPWLRPMGINIIKEAEAIVFISVNSYEEVLEKYIPNNYKDEFSKKALVIPNGISDFWHENINHEKNYNVHQPLRLVSTGRIVKTKRYAELMKLIHHYHKNIHPVEFHLIGPVWDEDHLAELQEYPELIYHGSKNPEEMLEIYRNMDIFVMLSYPETFGLVYVEAMSQALPVIYTKGQGFDGYFPNYHIGASVEAGNQEEFNAALDYLTKNYEKISSNTIKEVAQFNWDSIHQKYIELYEKILS